MMNRSLLTLSSQAEGHKAPRPTASPERGVNARGSHESPNQHVENSNCRGR